MKFHDSSRINVQRLRIFSTICLFHFSLILMGQSDFRPGYIITNQMDTLYGEINYQGEMLNGKSCIFHQTGKEGIQKFLPGEIFSYRFNNDHYYISKVLPFAEENKLVFARYIVDGIVSLYYYRALKGEFYFVETVEGELLKLENEQEIITAGDGTKRLKYSNRYNGILKYAMKDQPEIHTKINSTVIADNSLIELMTEYHKMVCADSIDCIVYKKEKYVPDVKFGIIAEYYAGRLDVNIDAFGFENVPVSEIKIGAGVILPLTKLNHRIELQSGLLFSRFMVREIKLIDLEREKYRETMKHFMDISWLEFKLNFSYKWRSEGPVVPYLNAGVLFDYAVRDKRESFYFYESIETGEMVFKQALTPVAINNFFIGWFAGMGAYIELNSGQIISLNFTYQKKPDTVYATIKGFNSSLSLWF